MGKDLWLNVSLGRRSLADLSKEEQKKVLEYGVSQGHINTNNLTDKAWHLLKQSPDFALDSDRPFSYSPPKLTVKQGDKPVSVMPATQRAAQLRSTVESMEVPSRAVSPPRSVTPSSDRTKQLQGVATRMEAVEGTKYQIYNLKDHEKTGGAVNITMPDGSIKSTFPTVVVDGKEVPSYVAFAMAKSGRDLGSLLSNPEPIKGPLDTGFVETGPNTYVNRFTGELVLGQGAPKQTITAPAGITKLKGDLEKVSKGIASITENLAHGISDSFLLPEIMSAVGPKTAEGERMYSPEDFKRQPETRGEAIAQSIGGILPYVAGGGVAGLVEKSVAKALPTAAGQILARAAGRGALGLAVKGGQELGKAILTPGYLNKDTAAQILSTVADDALIMASFGAASKVVGEPVGTFMSKALPKAFKPGIEGVLNRALVIGTKGFASGATGGMVVEILKAIKDPKNIDIKESSFNVLSTGLRFAVMDLAMGLKPNPPMLKMVVEIDEKGVLRTRPVMEFTDKVDVKDYRAVPQTDGAWTRMTEMADGGAKGELVLQLVINDQGMLAPALNISKMPKRLTGGEGAMETDFTTTPPPSTDIMKFTSVSDSYTDTSGEVVDSKGLKYKNFVVFQPKDGKRIVTQDGIAIGQVDTHQQAKELIRDIIAKGTRPVAEEPTAEEPIVIPREPVVEEPKHAELWRITESEYIKTDPTAPVEEHRIAVEKAISQGESVPKPVMAEYAKSLNKSDVETYHRYTENESPMSEVGHAMFVDNDTASDHYGKNHWILSGENVTNISGLENVIISSWEYDKEHGFTGDFGNMDTSQWTDLSGKDVFNELNPKKIVDSAAGYDDDLSVWLWERILEPLGINAVATNDGAISFDENIIKRVATHEEPSAVEPAAEVKKESITEEKPAEPIKKAETLVEKVEPSEKIKKVEPETYIIYRRDDKDIDPRVQKPHGVYFSIVDDKDTFKSPHVDEGDADFWGTATPKNPLIVDIHRIRHARFFGVGAEGDTSAGVSALIELLPADEFETLRSMGKEELIKKLDAEFPGPDYSRYYDSYELLEAYGGNLAKKEGYDAIVSRDEEMPQFSEIVVLDSGIMEVGAAEGVIPIAVKKSDIPRDIAEGAYRMVSFTPIMRADRDQQDYVNHMNNLYTELEPLAVTDEQKQILIDELERYKSRYIDMYIKMAQASSRTASTMITGPSNFPTKKNEKALEIYNRRVNEFLEWQEKAKGSIKKKLKGAMTQDEKADKEYRRLKEEALDTIATLKEIESGELKGFIPSAFRASFRGMLERSYRNRNYEAVQKVLTEVKELQKDMKYKVFADNNSIWRLLTQETPEVATGEKSVAEFEGARVIENFDADRVQILFDEKPPEEVTKTLRGSGWRWAPSASAWQRKLTPNAKLNAKSILKKHYQEPIVTETPKEAPATVEVPKYVSKRYTVPGNTDKVGAELIGNEARLYVYDGNKKLGGFPIDINTYLSKDTVFDRINYLSDAMRNTFVERDGKFGGYAISEENMELLKSGQTDMYTQGEAGNKALDEVLKEAGIYKAPFNERVAERVAKETASTNILDGGEEIEKGIIRVGDTVYKPLVNKLGKKDLTEYEMYKLCNDNNIDGVAKAELVTIAGKDYLKLPYFDHVISIDTVEKSKRERIGNLLTPHISKMNNIVTQISHIGIDYADVMQFAIKDNDIFLMDFSIASIREGMETLTDNMAHLAQYYNAFGLDKASHAVSRGVNLLEILNSDLENIFPGSDEEAEALARQGDIKPRYAYYAVNARPIEIKIPHMQTEHKDGFRLYFTERPLTDNQVNEWELTPITYLKTPQYPADKIFTAEELIALNEEMISRGAPAEIDGQGYNKIDYNIGTFMSGKDLTSRQLSLLAKILAKYGNTQLGIEPQLLTNTSEHYATPPPPQGGDVEIKLDHSTRDKEWVAEITGLDPQFKYKRDFVSYLRTDWIGSKKSGDSYYSLSPGKVYQIHNSNKKSYFAIVENGQVKEIEEAEVAKLLGLAEEASSGAEVVDRKIVLTFPRAPSRDILNDIKRHGFRYNGKVWTGADNETNRSIVKKHMGIDLGEVKESGGRTYHFTGLSNRFSLRDVEKGEYGRVVATRGKAPGDGVIYDLGEKTIKILRSHQRDGAYLAISAMDNYGGFILSDGTGTGKTMLELAVANYYTDKGTVLIVVPNKGIINTRFKEDAKTLDVKLHEVVGRNIEEDKINITTYKNMATHFKRDVSFDYIIFDESHNLKNYRKGTAQADVGVKLSLASKGTMFASATPIDKAEQLGYLQQLGILDNAGGYGGLMESLGYRKREIITRSRKVITYERAVSVEDAEKRIDTFFEELGDLGLVVKREISMDSVDIEFRTVKLDDEVFEKLDMVERNIEERPGLNPGLKRALTLMTQRRFQEPYKIAEVKDITLKELEAGNQVVIFATRIEDSELIDFGTGLEVDTSEGTITTLYNELTEQGVPVSKIFGGGSVVKAVNDFQSGKTKVAIVTPQKGGAGLSLDDTRGDSPRTMIIMTPAFSAVDNVQIVGRVNRLNTASKSKVIYLFANTPVDEWNIDIINEKMKILSAAVKGDVERLDVTFKEEPKAEAVTDQKIPKVMGATSKSETERGTAIDTQLAVVSADDLIISHDTGLHVNKEYPSELQPRDRSRMSSKMQITEISQNLKPQWLGDSPKASEGAPIVGEDMVVEVGNGRAIAIKLAYERKFSSIKEYNKWLRENAGALGIDKDELNEIKEPVLVRIRQTEVDRVKFAQEANEQSTTAMSATEQAIVDADNISEGLLGLFTPSDTGDIITTANRAFVQGFMSDVVGPSERGRYLMTDGSVSQEGINRMRNAIYAKAYGDVSAIEKLAESPDDNIRNITRAMLISAPNITNLKFGIENGNYYNLDISRDIADAALKISELRESGVKIETYLSQIGLFGGELSDIAKELLNVFETYKRGAKKLTAILQNYVNIVEAIGNPDQISMLGSANVTKLEVLEAAIRKEEGDEQTTIWEDRHEEDTSLRKDQAKDSESLAEEVIREEVTLDAKAKPINVIRELPKEVSIPNERYYVELFDAAKQLGSPARYKRLEKTLGQFVVNKGGMAIHLRRVESIATAAHEVGHLIDYTLGLNKNLKERQELVKATLLMRPVKKLDAYRNKPEELVADFIGLYLLDPTLAEKTAPNTTKVFLSEIDKSAEVKEVVEALLEARDIETNELDTSRIRPDIKLQEVDIFDKAKTSTEKAKTALAFYTRKEQGEIMKAKMRVLKWEQMLSEEELEDIGAMVEKIGNLRTGRTYDEIATTATNKMKAILKEYAFEMEKARQDLNEILETVGDKEYISYIEDYLYHFYNFKGGSKKRRSAVQRWSRTSPNARQRKFMTLQEAVDAGFEPKTQNVATLYKKWVEVNWRMATNRLIFKQLKQMNLLRLPQQAPNDWVLVDHPLVRQVFADITKDGKTLLLEEGAAIEPDAYAILRGLLEKPITHPVFKTVETFNAFAKAFSQKLSFYHFGNLTESAQATLARITNPLGGFVILGKDAKELVGIPIAQPHRLGLALIEKSPELVTELVELGLQFDPIPDAHVGRVNKAMDDLVERTLGMKGLHYFVKGARDISKGYDNLLWNRYFTGLKAYSAYAMMADALQDLPDDTTERDIRAVKERIVQSVNDAYGGQEWETKTFKVPKFLQERFDLSPEYGITPNEVRMARIFLRSPDYTLSNINIFRKLFKGGNNPEDVAERRFARGYWVAMILSMYAFFNAISYAINGRGIEGNEVGHKFEIEVTPIIKTVMGDRYDGRRYYTLPGKQVREVLRYFTNPVEILGAKASPFVHTFVEQMTGSSLGHYWDMDWKKYDMNFYESLPSRTLSVMEKFVPMISKGNSFAWTFPMRKGMNRWQAQKSMEDLIKSSVDPGFLSTIIPDSMSKLIPKKDMLKLLGELEEACGTNGIDFMDVFNSANSKVRTDYYSKFWKAVEAGKNEDAAKALMVLQQLGVTDKGLSQSFDRRYK